MDVSSSQEWDRESEWESSYGEETGYKIIWEKAILTPKLNM